MSNRVTRSFGSQGPVNRVHHCDEALLQALVTAAALVALSDGQVDPSATNLSILSIDKDSSRPFHGARLPKPSPIACASSRIATAPA
jgi:hypothetical protein